MTAIFSRAKVRIPLDRNRLKAARTALGLSMIQAGDLAGFKRYPAQQWNAYESGRIKYPNKQTVRDLARVVRLKVEEIRPQPPGMVDEPAPQTEYDRGHARGYKKGFDTATATMHDGCYTEGEIAAAFDRGVRAGDKQAPSAPPPVPNTDADLAAAYDAGDQMGRTVGYEQGHKAGYDSGHLAGYAAGLAAAQVELPTPTTATPLPMPDAPEPNTTPTMVKSIYDILG